MIRGLTASDTTLVVHSPAWIGLLLVGVGVALMAGMFVRRWPRPVRLGGLLGTIILMYGGWHLLRSDATFEKRGFYVDGMLGEEERVGWLQVNSVEAQPDRLVIQLRSGGESSVDLAGLSAEEQARVLAFARGRVKR
ncbi:MAG TPA: hypothetical protein VFD95_05150 [Usitatibacter sp.]|nr:hypothetical protein [Usitatibacter sp.]